MKYSKVDKHSLEKDLYNTFTDFSTHVSHAQHHFAFTSGGNLNKIIFFFVFDLTTLITSLKATELVL